MCCVPFITLIYYLFFKKKKKKTHIFSVNYPHHEFYVWGLLVFPMKWRIKNESSLNASVAPYGTFDVSIALISISIFLLLHSTGGKY